MRILLLCTGFAPEPTGAGPLNTEMATTLAARGHDVTVATTFPHFPQWAKAADYRGRHLATEDHRGVRVRRSECYVPSTPTPKRRIAYDSLVSASIAVNAVRAPRPDVVMAVCTPLQLGLGAALLARRWKVPFVFHVQDLIPDSAVELDMLSNGRAIRLANTLADAVYRRANLITVIGPTMADAIERRGIARDRIEQLPNWVDTTWLVPGSPGTPFRAEIGATADDFVVGYVGNIGFKQRMATVIEAAAQFTDPTVRFSIVGEGSDLPAVRDRAQQLGVTNVDFKPVLGRERLPEMLATPDVLVLHQAANVVDMVVPSKLLTYAAAGRPVILAGHPRSAGSLFVEASGGGLVVPPEDPVALAAAITELRDDPARRAAMGAAGRAHVVAHYDVRTVLDRAEALLAQTVAAGTG